MKRIIKFFKWWWKEIENTCPHCGHYCNGKSHFCNPPDNIFNG